MANNKNTKHTISRQVSQSVSHCHFQLRPPFSVFASWDPPCSTAEKQRSQSCYFYWCRSRYRSSPSRTFLQKWTWRVGGVRGIIVVYARKSEGKLRDIICPETAFSLRTINTRLCCHNQASHAQLFFSRNCLNCPVLPHWKVFLRQQ